MVGVVEVGVVEVGVVEVGVVEVGVVEVGVVEVWVVVFEEGAGADSYFASDISSLRQRVGSCVLLGQREASNEERQAVYHQG